MQAVGVVVTFTLIFYLSIKRVDLWKVMFLATAVMAATSGLSIRQVFEMIRLAIVDRATLELAAAVLSIGIFSTAMRELGFLDKTVSGLATLLGNVKAAIMTVPALIGSMPVLGGAALSAPLVDKLGEPLKLSPAKKAAANLVFRHGMFFIFPFSPSLILASQLTGFSVPTLISRLWFMSLSLWGIGYLALLRKERVKQSTPESVEEAAATGVRSAKASRAHGFIVFVKYGGPLLLALALGLALKWPLYLALTAGTFAAFLLSIVDGAVRPSANTMFKGILWGQILAMFGIMAFKAFVTASPVFPALVEKATSTGVSPVLLAALLPLVFGFGSASQTATIGVLLPILVSNSYPDTARLYMISLIYAASFTAYFFSPLHLCQVLTCQYFKVEIPQVYRLNWPVAAGFMGIIAGYMILLSGAM